MPILDGGTRQLSAFSSIVFLYLAALLSKLADEPI
jgi:hypothetical protein